MNRGTVLLDRAKLASLLSLEACIEAVEEAFRLHGEGKTAPPGLLHVDAHGGEFHVKAGVMQLDRPLFAAKINGGFFRNRERFGMANIQGLVILSDAENGYPLAVMDSKEITVKRTGAATAVAAKYLARPDSRTLTLCGLGTQGQIQLEALLRVLPIAKVHAYSLSPDEMERFARESSDKFGIQVVPAPSLAEAMSESDVCITCTPARKPFLLREYVKPGTFVSAIGADSPDKQELESSLLAGNKVVADILDQCVEVGEIHHGLKDGIITAKDVHAELGELAAGKKPGRTDDREITIFDATGTALQDIAAAAVVYRSVQADPQFQHFDFFA